MMLKKIVFLLALIFLFSSIKTYSEDVIQFNSDRLADDLVDSLFGTSAKVTDVVLAKEMIGDGEPSEITNSFLPTDQKIYIFLKLENIDGNDPVKVNWSYYQTNKSWVNAGKFEVDPPKGAKDLYFFLSRDDGGQWPEGQYKADVYIDDTLAISKSFTVKGASGKTIASSSQQTTTKKNTSAKNKSEIINVVMSKAMDSNNDPKDVTESFFTTDMAIYVFFNTKNVNSSDTLSSKWYVMNNSQWEEFADTSINPPEKTTNAHFVLKKTDGEPWYEGEYKVDIFVKDISKATKYFTINADEQKEKEIVSSVISKSNDQAKEDSESTYDKSGEIQKQSTNEPQKSSSDDFSL